MSLFYSKCQVNILLVTVGRGDCHWPLCWELLANQSGNSHADDRTALLDFCLRVLGPGRVGLVVGDRGFGGHKWFNYLKDKALPFVMRLPKHPLLTDRRGRSPAVADWQLQPGQCRRLAECQVDGVWGGAPVTALAGGEYLFLFGTANPAYLGQFYRKRWTIEACFQNLKGRGFALRGTHLQCRAKLKKLVGLVSLACALCVSVGTRLHENVQLRCWTRAGPWPPWPRRSAWTRRRSTAMPPRLRSWGWPSTWFTTSRATGAC